ncbi:AAA family ATPase [Chryseobacterium potabilaquae]|uniref:NadR/Ttd14 AAA domain-containing protein n=1 Tax=Chryseobacterium potabilaquae TaxID=2675057 RepID=A0A6N4XEX1_9FLAO|nr:AAA family ATPase [Chryseobacterium potabilaquae]CAA7197196.1 hypothetical protein CHRY9293_03250 [Chryseobacterium potabilaquae]
MENRKDNFYIITGGPGVGKTTLITGLHHGGFETVEEEARKIIKNQIETKSEGLPWKNKKLYASLMLEASLKSYDKIIAERGLNLTFFDRGILDSICYMKMEKIPISEKVIELIKLYSFNKNVFILPPWKEIYETDNERKQNWNEAESTYQKMNETYQEFGYHTIEVPKLTTQERIKFILQHISQ